MIDLISCPKLIHNNNYLYIILVSNIVRCILYNIYYNITYKYNIIYYNIIMYTYYSII